MINPYTIDIPDERLTAIRIRMEADDWSQLPDTGGWRSGVGVDDLRRLVDYWRDRYDWREVERRLNKLPHFTVDIEGERLHFVHMHGDGSKPPLLLLHGWPGSFLEFERLLEPLSADRHDVIVPSLPGFAFSNPITGIIGPCRAAELMHGRSRDIPLRHTYPCSDRRRGVSRSRISAPAALIRGEDLRHRPLERYVIGRPLRRSGAT
jgi:hypothetical protein